MPHRCCDDALCDSSRSGCTHTCDYWVGARTACGGSAPIATLHQRPPRKGCPVSAVEMHIPHFLLRAVTYQATAKRWRCVSLHEQKEGAYRLSHQQVKKRRGGRRNLCASIGVFHEKSTCLDGGLCGDRHAPCVRRRVFLKPSCLIGPSPRGERRSASPSFLQRARPGPTDASSLLLCLECGAENRQVTSRSFPPPRKRKYPAPSIISLQL